MQFTTTDTLPAGQTLDEERWCEQVENIGALVDELANGFHGESALGLKYWLYRYVAPKVRWWRGMDKASGKAVDATALRMSLAALELRSPNNHETTTILFSHPESLSNEIKVLRKIFAGLDSSLTAFVIGSHADRGTTAFSDCDLVVIVEPPSWGDDLHFAVAMSAIEKASHALQCMDPYQHHGIIVLLRHDVNCWNEAIVPLRAIEGGVSICGVASLSVRRWRNIHGTNLRAKRLISESMELVLLLGRAGLNTYNLKLLISSLSLLPCLIFQLAGRDISKKEGIAHALLVLSSQSVIAQSWASQIRARWKNVLLSRPPKSHRIPLRYRRARRDVIENHFRGLRKLHSGTEIGTVAPMPFKSLLAFLNEAVKMCDSDQTTQSRNKSIVASEMPRDASSLPDVNPAKPNSKELE